MDRSRSSFKVRFDKLKREATRALNVIGDICDGVESLGSSSCFVGGAINMTVMAANGGKMPVVGVPKFESETHFSADEKTFLVGLSDWMKINIDPKDVVTLFLAYIAGVPTGRLAIASPGDILIFSGRLITAVAVFLKLSTALVKDLLNIIGKRIA